MVSKKHLRVCRAMREQKWYTNRISLRLWIQFRVVTFNLFTSQPFAIAKPPPSRRMIFQGTESWAFFHESRGTYGVFEAEGKCGN